MPTHPLTRAASTRLWMRPHPCSPASTGRTAPRNGWGPGPAPPTASRWSAPPVPPCPRRRRPRHVGGRAGPAHRKNGRRRNYGKHPAAQHAPLQPAALIPNPSQCSAAGASGHLGPRDCGIVGPAYSGVRAVLFAGTPVLPRGTTWGWKTWSVSEVSVPLSRSRICCQACSPTSMMGTAAVVSGGVV